MEQGNRENGKWGKLGKWETFQTFFLGTITKIQALTLNLSLQERFLSRRPSVLLHLTHPAINSMLLDNRVLL